MTPDHRWFPTSLQERAAWFQNFAANLAGVATVLGIEDTAVTAAAKDSAWMQFIAQKTVEIDAFKKAVREYRLSMTEGHVGDPGPVAPTAPTLTPPPAPAAGLFQRLSELVRRIRVAPAYTDEVGAMLGISPLLTSTSPPRGILQAEAKPTIKVSGTFSNYAFTIRVARLGMDSFKVQIRRMENEAWVDAAFGTASPITIDVQPTEPGKPERIQVRAVLMSRNAPVGQPSDPTYVTVNP
jgi:hypothetical protein